MTLASSIRKAWGRLRIGSLNTRGSLISPHLSNHMYQDYSYTRFMEDNDGYIPIYRI